MVQKRCETIGYGFAITVLAAGFPRNQMQNTCIVNAFVQCLQKNLALGFFQTWGMAYIPQKFNSRFAAINVLSTRPAAATETVVEFTGGNLQLIVDGEGLFVHD